jgi:soluble lytic murein transglycosylase-like protein
VLAIDDVVEFILDFIFPESPVEDVMGNGELNIRDQKIVALIVKDIVNTNPKVNMQTAISWAERIVYVAQKYDINPFLIASQANLESSWNPLATGGKGDAGLIQIMPATSREIARKLGIKNFHTDMLYNPMTNIEFAAFYLDYCYDKTKKYVGGDQQSHDWLALASYNKGVVPAVKEFISGKLSHNAYVEHVRRRFMENYNGIGVIFDY